MRVLYLYHMFGVIICSPSTFSSLASFQTSLYLMRHLGERKIKWHSFMMRSVLPKNARAYSFSGSCLWVMAVTLCSVYLIYAFPSYTSVSGIAGS